MDGPDDQTRLPQLSLDTSQTAEIPSLRNAEPQEGESVRLVENLRGGFPAAVVDLVLNFTPGIIAELLLHWQPVAVVLLGGVTYVSSSGVIAKVLADLRRLENPETPAVLSTLVLEDLAMAVYLPLVAVLIAGGGSAKITLSVSSQ
jgi:K+:H+ antiporter subunit KhtU